MFLVSVTDIEAYKQTKNKAGKFN